MIIIKTTCLRYTHLCMAFNRLCSKTVLPFVLHIEQNLLGDKITDGSISLKISNSFIYNHLKNVYSILLATGQHQGNFTKPQNILYFDFIVSYFKRWTSIL